MKKKNLFTLSLMMLQTILLVSCKSTQKDEVHKHEVEIKPIKVKVDVDVTVTKEKETEEESKKRD